MSEPDALADTAVKPAGQRPAGLADLPPHVPGYQVTGEIARGGMGVVYAARDLALDREVAVKTLQRGMSGRRFEREARITAKLPHPGVPPVYALGTLADGRPFLAMKLIRGRTLDAELRARPDPAHDLGRFVGVFGQVCQAVAYAHARGIIHRDLKPLNVMVGEFGEVQVMDWGLAKDRGDPGNLTSREVPVLDTADSSGHTPGRQGADTDDHTRAGSGWGTPGFMPPEQAEGRWELVGPRADVYALGSVLCGVLTGQAAYRGPVEATDRLARCRADAELVALATRCLSTDPIGRPADAGEIAGAVAAYQAGVADRLRAAEVDRAGAEVRAAEERRKRRWQLAALTAAGLLGAGGGAFAWWLDQRAAGERVRVERNTEAVADLADRCEAAVRRSDREGGDRADVLLKEIDRRLPEGVSAALRERIARCRADLAVLRELDRVDDFRWGRDGQRRPDETKVASRWRAAFAGLGVRPGETPPADAARHVAGSLVRDRLLAALDLWLVFDPSAGVRDLLREADPDPYREQVRDAVLAQEPARVAELAGRPEAAVQPPRFAAAFGQHPAVPVDTRRKVLEAALVSGPGDLTLLMSLGKSYPPTGEGTMDEVRWFQAAVAAHPGNVIALYNLGRALRGCAAPDRADAYFREVLRLDPGFGPAHDWVGLIRLDRGDPGGALPFLREAVRLDPASSSARYNLGVALGDLGEAHTALAEFREVLRLDPGHAKAHNRVAFHQLPNGDVDDALRHAREAARFDPRFDYAHMNVGWALRLKGDLDGSLAAYREAVRVGPKNPWSHFNLGTALQQKGDLDGARGCYREAVRLDPTHVQAQNNLGVLLERAGDFSGAVAYYREAVQLAPNAPLFRRNLDRASGKLAKQDGRVAPPPREATVP